MFVCGAGCKRCVVDCGERIEYDIVMKRQNTNYISIENISKKGKSKLGDKNPMWLGDKVSYKPLHAWVRRHKVKLDFCENCKEGKALDLANISQEYKRDIDDWEWLCRKCHMTKDGRMNNLRQFDTVYAQKYIINKEELIKLRMAGYTHKKIADYFNCSQTKILTELRKYGYR